MTNEICKYTGKKGYVKEEDCHCFCCGIHEGKPRNHSPPEDKELNSPELSNTESNSSGGDSHCSDFPNSNHHAEKHGGNSPLTNPELDSVSRIDGGDLSSKRICVGKITLGKLESQLPYYVFSEQDIKDFIQKLMKIPLILIEKNKNSLDYGKRIIKTNKKRYITQQISRTNESLILKNKILKSLNENFKKEINKHAGDDLLK